MEAKHLKIGQICEQVCSKHLKKINFNILERNYRKKWGEIDLIASKDNILHFIEVKGSSDNLSENKPEDNVNIWKRKRLWRAIQTWLMEHPEYEDADWQVDVMAVFLDLSSKKARIRWTKNIILE